MNLLLDVNIVIDLCAPRIEWHEQSMQAIEHSKVQADSLWLYAGSVQTLVYNLHHEIRRVRPGISYNVAMRLVLEELKEFSKDKQWLAALAEEGDVFDSVDPEDEQLIRALKRFPTEDIKLLTRDTLLLKKYPDKAISPERYCQIDKLDKSLNFIDLKAQQRSIRPALEKNIHRVLHHGRYIMGPEVKELETRLCNYTGAKHCIGVSSGTDALLMPLMAMDIGPGDAVFTTPFTFIATAEVIRLLGATPVFVDIDPGTFNLDPGKLASAIEAVRKNDPAIYPLPQQTGPLSPKAVMPVDLFGLPADYDPIMALAEAHGLKVLSDSAQGFGSVYKERKSGTLGHATATSFFPAKPLGAYGDGGAIFTDDEDLAARLESIRVHGKGTDKYDNIRIGLNARLDTLQAAILLAKLEAFPQEVQLRQEVAKRYTDLLSTQSSALSTPFIPEGMKSAWAQYSLLARDQDLRARIQAQFKDAGIPTMVYYPTPLHMQTAFAYLGYKPEDFPVSFDVSKKIFSIPMHPYIGNWELDRILTILKEVERI